MFSRLISMAFVAITKVCPCGKQYKYSKCIAAPVQGLPEVARYVIEMEPGAIQQRTRKYGSVESCIRKHCNVAMRSNLAAALQHCRLT